MTEAPHQFKLRLPGALFAQVEAAAKAAKRSASAEMISRLEASFAPQSDPVGLERQVRRLQQKIDMLAESLSANPKRKQGG